MLSQHKPKTAVELDESGAVNGSEFLLFPPPPYPPYPEHDMEPARPAWRRATTRKMKKAFELEESDGAGELHRKPDYDVLRSQHSQQRQSSLEASEYLVSPHLPVTSLDPEHDMQPARPSWRRVSARTGKLPKVDPDPASWAAWGEFLDDISSHASQMPHGGQTPPLGEYRATLTAMVLMDFISS